MGTKDFWQFVETEWKAPTRTYASIFNGGERLDPLFVIALAAKELGWGLTTDSDYCNNNEIQGLTVGTEKYIDTIADSIRFCDDDEENENPCNTEPAKVVSMHQQH